MTVLKNEKLNSNVGSKKRIHLNDGVKNNLCLQTNIKVSSCLTCRCGATSMQILTVSLWIGQFRSKSSLHELSLATIYKNRLEIPKTEQYSSIFIRPHEIVVARQRLESFVHLYNVHALVWFKNEKQLDFRFT